MAGPRRLLGQVLKDLGLVHEGQVQEALMVQRERQGRLGELLVELGHLDEAGLARGLAAQAGLDFVDLATVTPDAAAIARIDAGTARAFGVLPLRIDGGVLTVALGDPLNVSVLPDLGFTAGMEVHGVVADEARLKSALDAAYRDDGGPGRGKLQELVAELSREGAKFDLEDKAAMASAAPVVKLLNYILYQAIRDKASDIHLEPFEAEFKMRYRVDGVLYELEAPPPHLAVALISRVKVMADLDIAETRLPQDGRIELTVGGKPVDLRVSTLPTMFGESCVMRVLDRSVVSLDLGNLGFADHERVDLERLLTLPHGIVLVTGPTGSGKTTTLYAMLNEVNREDVKVITVEDPVEYDLEGIVQIPVNDDIGVTYARVLRTILRQDPDVILVGEIRDRETAQTAIEASLTGHLVFSTLHTNDAPSAIARLIDIGVEPFLLTATVQAVVAQRLVRRICDRCRVEYEPSDDVLHELGLRREDVGDARFARGQGCDACNFTGYRGRMALGEILVLDERLRTAILDAASTGELTRIARETGMRTLRAAGLRAIHDRVTTVDEVLRETIHETV
ncbi:MAG: Flp pilus assembly complex ATPase component TadA [Planctomycetes bacterium]|nr:Flp pilus assembly complex ATPase component TadA [Planctomycetota bacterium]